MTKSQSRYKAKKIWERHNRSIPKGMHLHHRDGNPYNNNIDNLMVCTPKEHIELHRQLGDKIQPNFIGRANFYEFLSEKDKKIFKNKGSESGKLGRGVKRTLEQRTKLRLNSRMSSPIEMVDSKTGKIINEYSSVKHASEELEIQRAHIRRVIKGLRKSWRGAVFRYKD